MNVFDRVTLQDPVLFVFAVEAVMRCINREGCDYDEDDETRIREETTALFEAIRDRRGVFVSYEDECAMWGFPDWVELREPWYRNEYRFNAKLAVRMAGPQDYAHQMDLDCFSVSIITAPHDAVIERF